MEGSPTAAKLDLAPPTEALALEEETRAPFTAKDENELPTFTADLLSDPAESPETIANDSDAAGAVPRATVTEVTATEPETVSPVVAVAAVSEIDAFEDGVLAKSSKEDIIASGDQKSDREIPLREPTIQEIISAPFEPPEDVQPELTREVEIKETEGSQNCLSL